MHAAGVERVEKGGPALWVGWHVGLAVLALLLVKHDDVGNTTHSTNCQQVSPTPRPPRAALHAALAAPSTNATPHNQCMGMPHKLNTATSLLYAVQVSKAHC